MSKGRNNKGKKVNSPNSPSNNEKAEKKNRTRVKFNATLNFEALKSLENTIVGSFIELAHKVILIDGKPYDEAKYTTANGNEQNLKLTTGRKNDFMRLIEPHAIIEPVGIKYHIKKVFNDKEQETLGDVLLQKRIDKMRHG